MLQVNKFYDPRGGTERVLFDLEDGLRALGHEVGIFAGSHAGNRASAGPSWFVPERNYESPSFAERVGHAMGTLYDRGARNHLAQALDEFFRVRVASLRSLLGLGAKDHGKLGIIPHPLPHNIHRTVLARPD